MNQELANNIPKTKLVYCLSIDLVASTEHFLDLTTDEQARFNWALSQQLGPHLTLLGLSIALIKFTGDGWLLMTHDESEAVRLAALALVMQARFEREMQLHVGDTKAVPALRMSICAGNDTLTLLATGAGDYIGNSARRCVRVPNQIANGEIVIDEVVRQKVEQDLELVALEAVDSATPRYSQVPQPLYRIKGIRAAAAKRGFWQTVHEHRMRAPALSPHPVCRPALVGQTWQKLTPLDFTFVWGDLTQARFQPDRVTLKRREGVWSPPSLVAGCIWDLVARQWQKAIDEKRDFHFRPLTRVTNVRVLGDHAIELATESTMYIQFAATNLALGEREMQKLLTDWSPASTAQAWQPFLSSALNVIGCVISQDGYLFVPKRGNTFEKPGRYQASTGGFVDRADHDVESAFRREIEEELGIQRSIMMDVTFLGFGYNELTGEPDLLAMAACPLTKDSILSVFRQHKAKRASDGKKPAELSAMFETVEEAQQQRSRWKSVWKLDAEELPELFSFLAAKNQWSQPSDRAVVLGSFCRELGADIVAASLARWHQRG